MKKVCALVFMVFILAGCYQPERRDNLKEYDWAVEFCGGKDKVYSFNAFQALSSQVECTGGRYSIVPTFYK